MVWFKATTSDKSVETLRSEIRFSSDLETFLGWLLKAVIIRYSGTQEVLDLGPLDFKTNALNHSAMSNIYFIIFYFRHLTEAK